MATVPVVVLVERKEALVAQLAEVDAEIRSRHGEVDKPAPPKKSAAKKK